MKKLNSISTIAGILLICAGVLLFAYEGYTYTTQEKIAQIGDVQLFENQEKTIHFPPLVGGLAIVAGIVLVVIGRKK